ncbi:hypothetical protein TNCV_3772071 [Trichonephila clavipes]|nr:hypothetical protein TNCV_3772071 [Trichonephila clavipes]
MNETTQQEKTTQLSSRNEQLNSATGTKQLNPALPSTAYNRLQLPTAACNRQHRLQPPAPPLQQNRLFLPTPLGKSKISLGHPGIVTAVLT